MMYRKLLLTIGLLAAFAGATPVAEYCAEILNDSTYRPLLIKDLNEPIREWNYPKTIPCSRSRCEVKWETKSEVSFPRDLDCRNGWPRKVYCFYNIDDSPVCDSCSGYPMKLDRIKKMELNGSEMRDPNSCKISQWTLHNARESLKKFYGKAFRGEWIGWWNTNDNGALPQMRHEFLAKLVGECVDTIPVMDYCVAEGKNAELHLVRSYENLPRPAFAAGTKKDETMKCEGTMRVEKTYEMDFGKYGTRKLVHFVEEDTCHGTSIIAKEAYMPVFKHIDAKTLKGIPARSLYGKTVSVTSKNILTCNFDTIEKNVHYVVRVVGKCGKRDLQKKEKLNIFELKQVKDVQAYHESLIEDWETCGNGVTCPTTCIEMKDLLK
ncbi:MAG: hypothetical protein IK012_10315 [Fibrobacter sp.]|uniref:hypothetical protein n=1 Tax=Fibrobacter sp. TaxID=35828 RepID=UPI0025BD1B8D|nr:hypothetical protein [Fibrobacter sp.]MBR4785626.1 hypothetical protein [Fibrobacter sp.]